MKRSLPLTRTLLIRSVKLVAFLALTGFAASDLQAQDCEDVSGVWAITLNAPGGGPQDVTLTLEQSDCDATGMVVGNNETEIDDGKVEGWTVTFGTTIDTPDGQTLEIAWEGTVEGNEITGTASIPGMGVADFAGTKTEG